MFDAVIFDLDGTLIDTERLAIAAGLLAFKRLGYPVEPTFLHGLVGLDTVTGAGLIRARFPELDTAALDRHWVEESDAMMAGSGLLLKPGATALLDLIALPRAIATSSGRARAAKKLKLAGLAARFDLVITLDDVTAAKPDPAPYLLTAARLGVDPARCLVFEDSETGAQSAHRAGMRVVQVPDILPTSGEWAHHVADDLLSGARAAGLI